METQGYYRVERKNVTVLPRFLRRWKVVGRDLNLDGVIRGWVYQHHDHTILEVMQRADSTVLKFRDTPHWSDGKYDKYEGTKDSGVPPDYVLYRITPRLEISFNNSR